uniref:Anterior gradient 2 n=1 Tax=Labrus bergylta TaxID=56723 RepID=A0A3Q3FCE6_9LABR
MIRAVLSLLLVLGAISSAFAAGDKKYIPKSGRRIPQTLSRGWGDQLIWAQTYEEALYWSRSRNKPLLVVFHLEDCPHSQGEQRGVYLCFDFQEMGLNKIFVFLFQYETTDKNLTPDGQYVPRFLFVDPSMTVRADIVGPYGNRLYAYEPQDLDSMEKAKKLLKVEL